MHDKPNNMTVMRAHPEVTLLTTTTNFSRENNQTLCQDQTFRDYILLLYYVPLKLTLFEIIDK